MPAIEYITTAAHAEAHNGLLYLTGAGWTDINRQVDAQGNVAPAHVGIGVSILMAWTEANITFPFSLTVEDEDQHRAPLISAEGQIETGRAPGLIHGSDLRSVIAINGEVPFPSAGGYRIMAKVGNETKSVSFRVRDIGPVPGMQVGPMSIPGR